MELFPIDSDSLKMRELLLLFFFGLKISALAAYVAFGRLVGGSVRPMEHYVKKNVPSRKNARSWSSEGVRGSFAT